jgi:hypothetical protein
MRKAGLLLLAVVMVLGLAGCGGGDDNDVELTVTLESCNRYPAVGRVSSVESGWVSGEFAINPGQSVSIDLDDEGLYRFFFQARDGYWDGTQEMHEGMNIMALEC